MRFSNTQLTVIMVFGLAVSMAVYILAWPERPARNFIQVFVAGLLLGIELARTEKQHEIIWKTGGF